MKSVLQSERKVADRASTSLETTVESKQRSNEDLLVSYRETKDRSLFTELVGRFERELYNYLRRYLDSAELAEDVFQSTFLQVHLKCDQFDEGRRFKPWLYAIATNQAIDAQRKDHRHRSMSLDRIVGSPDFDRDRGLIDSMVSPQPGPLTQAGDNERDQAVRDLLGQLSEQMRTVVQLVYYQGMKYREAADVMNIPVGTVKSRMHTAIARLAELWNQDHAGLDTE